MQLLEADVARFWAKVDKLGPVPEHRPELGPCWLWRGRLHPKGHGYFYLSGRDERAQRVAYEIAIGPIPEGMVTDHLCRVSACVRPTHLEPVTSRENTLRGNTHAATNAVKTSCIHGHQFTPENTYVYAAGRKRKCKACHVALKQRRSTVIEESVSPAGGPGRSGRNGKAAVSSR